MTQRQTVTKITILYLLVLTALVGLSAYLAISPISTSPAKITQTNRSTPLEKKLTDKVSITQLSHYASITARPVFETTRRPPEKKIAKKPKPVRKKRIQPRVQPVNNLRLLGVLINATSRKALIQQSRNSRGIWLEEGAAIRGWKLVSVTNEKVTLKSLNKSRELKLYVLSSPLQQ